jgi:hypothetical protein
MDILTLAIGAVPALLVGVVVGWYGHRLSLARDKTERRIADETERIDRCADIFSARWQYDTTWHRRGHQAAEPLRVKRAELEHRHPNERPQVFLNGAAAWEAFFETEQAMVRDTRAQPCTMNVAERVRNIDAAAEGVHRLLAERRRQVRGQ